MPALSHDKWFSVVLWISSLGCTSSVSTTTQSQALIFLQQSLFFFIESKCHWGLWKSCVYMAGHTKEHCFPNLIFFNVFVNRTLTSAECSLYKNLPDLSLCISCQPHLSIFAFTKLDVKQERIQPKVPKLKSNINPFSKKYYFEKCICSFESFESWSSHAPKCCLNKSHPFFVML